MTRPSPRKSSQSPRARLSDSLGGLIVLVCTLTIVGLAIADFARDGQVDQLLVSAIVVLALTFGGYGADKILGRFFSP